MTGARPMIETWYKSRQGDMFEVIAVDEQDDAIEIQFLDGSVEELDQDGWLSLEPKVIDAPREALDDSLGGDEGAEAFDEGDDDDRGWGLDLGADD